MAERVKRLWADSDDDALDARFRVVHNAASTQQQQHHHHHHHQHEEEVSAAAAAPSDISAAANKPAASGLTRQSVLTSADSVSSISTELSALGGGGNTNMSAGVSSGSNTIVSPYGTRSRNRIGGTRPNYAEDKDPDTDDNNNNDNNNHTTNELNSLSDHDSSAMARRSRPTTEKKPATSTAPAATATPAQPADRPGPGVSTRRASAALGSGKKNEACPPATSANTPAAVTKDSSSIPGTSTFSASPSTTGPPAKRRKVTAPEKTGGNPASNNSIPTHSTSGSRGATATTSTSSGKKTSNTNPTVSAPLLTNMLRFDSSKACLRHGKLKADDGTVLRVNDHVYLVCEPPGEPYYLARIMEFIHSNNQHHLPIEAIRVNWYYRPRDINRKVTDTRIVFATMHSDVCPLTSLRGKCRILHRSEINDIDEYRKTRDCFWYERLFDRYIHRYYDVIPVSQVINVPAHVKKVLDERWKFLVVEIGRGKELTSAVKSCKRCGGYCASHDSVECAVCHSTYHMNCVRPPLLKKPSRGFAWACGPCNRAQEKKLEARNTQLIIEISAEREEEEEEVYEEEDDDNAGGDNGASNNLSAGDPSEALHPATPEQSAHAKMWPYRYLGQHCRVEDALDYDDRIYPRASSRLGPKHQANIPPWPGRPIEYVKPVEIKRKYAKGANNKKDAKLSKETVAALEAEKVAREKRPKWVLDEPPGYVQRGGDYKPRDPESTAELIFKMPEDAGSSAAKAAVYEQLIDDYIEEVKDVAVDILGISRHSTNLLDVALQTLHETEFDYTTAAEQMEYVDLRRDLKEPIFGHEDEKRFEEAVAKYGSELHNVTKHVGTKRHADIVRYYYLWKKTPKGSQIWANYEGRRGKKEAKRADTSKFFDDAADDNDDSAFDEAKATRRKRNFECKFCRTRSSKQWRRAPGVTPGATVNKDANAKLNGKDKGTQTLIALCRRCAELWRRYGIQWEDIDEVAKKVAQGGGKAWKRRIDEELLKELVSTSYGHTAAAPSSHTATANTVTSHPAAASASNTPVVEPSKKKLKAPIQDRDSAGPTARSSPSNTVLSDPQKKKTTEKAPRASPVPELPKPKALPCAICELLEPFGEQLLTCKDCRITVHRSCYGVVGELRHVGKWLCDMCSNDKNPQVSTIYECVLCPVKFTEYDMIEMPKSGNKKKSEKDREKDREAATAAAELYRLKQEEMNRPTHPREALKRTAGNNWVHVTCAVWTPEIKFANAKALEPAEGIGTIPRARYEQTCKVCQTSKGACVLCHQCHAPVHVACARKAGYTLGFDIIPVKSSRREHINTVSLGDEHGCMSAAVWCKEHSVKTIVHPIHELSHESGLNALQVYVRNYKQADLALTGTARKANLLSQTTKMFAQAYGTTHGNRRGSTNTASITASSVEHGSPKCFVCGLDASPKWWEALYVAPGKAIFIDGRVPDCTCRPHWPILLSCPGPEPHREEWHRAPCSARARPLINPNTPAVYLNPNPNTSFEEVARELGFLKAPAAHTERLQLCNRCHVNGVCDATVLARAKLPPVPASASSPSSPSPPVDVRTPSAPAIPVSGAGRDWTRRPPSMGTAAMASEMNGTISTDASPAAGQLYSSPASSISYPARAPPPPPPPPPPAVHRLLDNSMDLDRPSEAAHVHVNGTAPHSYMRLTPTTPSPSVSRHAQSQANTAAAAAASTAAAPHSSLATVSADVVNGRYQPYHFSPPRHQPVATSQVGEGRSVVREQQQQPLPVTPRVLAAAPTSSAARPEHESRPSGGASASPSLRNLLS